MEFHEQTVEDINFVKEAIANSGEYGCDFAPSTPFLWGKTYGSKVCFYKDYYLIRGGNFFEFPIALTKDKTKQELKNVIQDMIDYCKEIATTCQIFGVTNNTIDILNELFPNKFTLENCREHHDYVYSTADLINLSGKKYQKKRNHISKFKRNYEYEYFDITKENIEEVRVMAKKWCDINYALRQDEDYFDELLAINKALDSYFEIGYEGGLIKVKDEIIAFTFGEKMSDTLFDWHFEKAFSEYDGIYTVINNEFATHNLAKYLYANREEDLGIEGLRKSKLSYFPAFLVEKRIATFM